MTVDAAFRPAGPAPLHECDPLTAHRDDASAVAPGVALEQIDPSRAIPACLAAVAERPDEPRFAFQLGRAHTRAGDFAEAGRWYRRAAAQGHTGALCGLADLVLNGQGVAADPAEAVRLLRLAAERGDRRGLNNLGILIGAGHGAPADVAAAVDLFRRAALQGDEMGLNNLAVCYANGIAAGPVRADGATAAAADDPAADDAEAVRLYRLAAEQGEALAQSNLGWMLLHGRGAPRDIAEALRLFRLAAAQGHPLGQVNLGFMHLFGWGVAPDAALAKALFRQAADQGHPLGRTALAEFHRLAEANP